MIDNQTNASFIFTKDTLVVLYPEKTYEDMVSKKKIPYPFLKGSVIQVNNGVVRVETYDHIDYILCAEDLNRFLDKGLIKKQVE